MLKMCIRYIIKKIYYIILTILNIIIMYLCSNINLFISLITIDSIYNAVDFIKNISDKKLTDSQVVNTSNNLYKIGTIDRYIYYSGTYVIHIFISNLVCNCELIIVRYMIGLTLLPFIFNNIIYKKLNKIFVAIINERTEIIKKIYCTQTANMIIYLKKIYFGNNVLLDKQEIINALYNLDNIKSEIWLFIRTFIIVYVLMYLRKYFRMYYKIAKYIYMYGYGEYVKDITLENAKILFENIINNKKYDQITKPMFIQSMIYLYNEREDNGEFTKFIKQIKYKTCMMFALWTLSSFVPISHYKYMRTMTILIMSLGIIFIRKSVSGKNIILSYIFTKSINIFNKNTIISKNVLSNYIDDRTIISMLMTAIIGKYTHNAFILSFVNQFSGLLLFNILIFNIFRVIYINTYTRIINLVKDMHYNYLNIIKYLSIVITYYVFMYSNYSHYTIFMLPTIINFIPRSKMFKYLYPLLFIGIINDNHYIKLFLLAYILAIVDNIIIKRFGHIIVNKYSILKINSDKNIKICDKKILIKSNYFNKSIIKSIRKSKIPKQSQLLINHINEDDLEDDEFEENDTKIINLNKSFNYINPTNINNNIKLKVDYTQPFGIKK